MKTMSSAAPRTPKITWWQRRSNLSLSFLCTGASEGEPVLDVSASKLSLSWDSFSFACDFLQPVDPSSVEWRRTGRDQQTLLMSVRKAQSKPHWRAPFAGGKLPFLAPDWDRWIDEDDDSEPDEPTASAPSKGGNEVANTTAGVAKLAVELPTLSFEPLYAKGGELRQSWVDDWNRMGKAQRMVLPVPQHAPPRPPCPFSYSSIHPSTLPTVPSLSRAPTRRQLLLGDDGFLLEHSDTGLSCPKRKEARGGESM